ncbi:hypothetical protein [Ammoniphilus sp. CFH 90114]|uniref:hypothetical protein n=1 Tax=Ammoniphilus sp. CFH 90114 TaxID=2493665 RepID=UPI0013E929EF|nr:hypothetical protein [Ammoniphilus sp. CFH 90114]
MYLGVFDLKQRLEHTRKLLKDKIRLKELLDDDIKELEQSIKDIEDMMNKTEKAILV